MWSPAGRRVDQDKIAARRAGTFQRLIQTVLSDELDDRQDR